MMETQVNALTAIGFRILLCLLGILGNTLLLFFSMPSLSCKIEPYKILLINLALSNLMTNFLVDIPGILVEMYGTWFLGESYCKIFCFTGSLSITSSILTAFAMSVFWFHKVVGCTPKNGSIFRNTEVRLLRISIGLCWLVSITFSTPLLFFCSMFQLKGDDDDQGQNKPPVERIFGCHDHFPSDFQKKLYVITYLVLANGLPLIGMFFINVKIVLFLIRNRKRITALKCTKTKWTSAFNSSIPGCSDPLGTLCQGSEGNNGVLSTCGAAKDMFYEPPLPSIPLTSSELDFVDAENQHAESKDTAKMVMNDADNEIPIQHFFQSLKKKTEAEEHKHPSASIIYDPFMVNHMQKSQRSIHCNLKDSHLVLIPEKDTIFVVGNTERQMLYGPVESYTAALNSPQEYCLLDAKDQPPAAIECPYKRNNKDFLMVKALTANLSKTTQIRAALSIMIVVSVFTIFWVVYLSLQIKEIFSSTERVIDTASLISASYTTITPYVFIYSMKKCPCG